MTATEISDAITAYSMTVAPQSSQNNLLIVLNILFFIDRLLYFSCKLVATELHSPSPLANRSLWKTLTLPMNRWEIRHIRQTRHHRQRRSMTEPQPGRDGGSTIRNGFRMDESLVKVKRTR